MQNVIECPDCPTGKLRSLRSIGGVQLMRCGRCGFYKWLNPKEVRHLTKRTGGFAAGCVKNKGSAKVANR